MRRESAIFLQKLYETIWQQLGASPEEARIFAKCYVRADLTGRDTQGVAYIPPTYRKVRNGGIRFGVPIAIVKEGPAFAVIDGGRGPGQVVATYAMEIAIQKAREATVGSVWVRNTNDYTMAANYSEMALEHDFIGLALSNGVPNVAPWGGRDQIFGTHPLSFAIPAGNEKPIVFDGGMSSVSHGAAIHAARKGVRLPGKYVVDEDGHITDDRSRIIVDPYDRSSPERGAILPLGPKGFGWLLWVDIVGGILSGMLPSLDNTRHVSAEEPDTRGFHMMAINVGNLVDLGEFKAKMDDLIRRVKASRLAEGFSEILMPGERSMREKEIRQREGVPIPAHYWSLVETIANDLGIDLEVLRETAG